MSGHVNISHYNFVHDNYCRVYGAAIHYSSSSVTNDQVHSPNAHNLLIFKIYLLAIRKYSVLINF